MHRLELIAIHKVVNLRAADTHNLSYFLRGVEHRYFGHAVSPIVDTRFSFMSTCVWVNVKRLRQSSLEAPFQLHPTIASKHH